MSDMDSQPLGPKHIRHYSILDSTDKGDLFTAYCDRHTQEMKEMKMPVKYDGAVYDMKDPFRVYTCPICQLETAQREEMSAKRVMYLSHMKSFLMWDDCESPGDWFEYLCEYDELDEDSRLIKFFGASDNE